VEKFNVAVVGAGPAGSAAARALAQRGFSVLLVERGNRPGQKSMFGGRVYAYPLEKWYPGWRQDCPVERFVVRESMVFAGKERSVSIDYEAPGLAEAKDASFTALRSKFDEWMAAKAEEAKATLITGIRVDDLWREGGRVRGIVAAGDRVAADVVILAEGAVSSLVRRAGLRRDLTPREESVGVKETLELPPKVIEERFGVDERTGAAMVFAGSVSGGCRGGGFLYTNKGTISLGLVVSSEDLARRKVQVGDLQEAYKRSPAVAKWVRGAKTVEYSAHLVPEMGMHQAPRLHGEGVLVAGDAAAFLINNGYTFRGVDLAMASGIAAAEAVERAHQLGAYTGINLAHYEERLRAHHVLDDLEAFSRAPGFLKNPRLFTTYPELICALAARVYGVDGGGRSRMLDTAIQEARRRKVPLLRLLRDLVEGARAM
jgi:electron transfer flavoprotein-quinone oxidoreductase